MNREVCGLNIHYIEEGEGPLVVLLHGWGSNIELFQPTVDLLKNNYKVVTMDMPGFGQSEEPDEPWDVDRYVDFLLAFLEPYHPDKVILLGHSFGGRVIIKLCARDLPFKVEKVILVDSAGVLPVKSPWEKFKQKLIRLKRSLKVNQRLLNVQQLKKFLIFYRAEHFVLNTCCTTI